MGIMTKEEIIELAKQAGFEEHQAKFDTRFEPFAKLVAEHEREVCIAHAMTSAEKAIDVAIKLEREACAKVCDLFQARDVGMQPAECAGAIRARGQE
jgi:hypothetical protein